MDKTATKKTKPTVSVGKKGQMTMTRRQWLALGEADPVGALEMADRLGVQRQTIAVWKRRHDNFPKPRWTVSSLPAWDWNADVVPWLKATRRYDWPADETEGL